ncbi:MAG: SpoIID/LytB domain-containing protein [Gemmatimonadota bacterium]
MIRWIASLTRSASSPRLALLICLGLASCAPLRPGPTIPGLPDREPTVRVGLVVDSSQVEVGATSDYQILDASGRVLHRLNVAERAMVRASADGVLIIRIGDTQTRAGQSLVVRPAASGFVNIAGEPYRGTALIRATGPDRLTAINQVDMENYLLGVVPFEIGRVGPELLEAAKAQAVAARTYAIRYLGRRAEFGFDVYATVQDQVYGGASGEHDPVSRAVQETAGEILIFGNEPIEAYYHSTCAGQTAAIEEVWPQEDPEPYLVSIVDRDPRTGEAFDISSNRFRWTQRWSASELEDILDRTLADSLPQGAESVGELRDFEVLQRTTSGRIRTLRITTSTATFDVGGDRIRWIFLTPSGSILNSSRFDITTVRDSEGRVIEVAAEGGGWGHGIGMCQVGAMGRARAGQQYRNILETYYPGTRIVDLY